MSLRKLIASQGDVLAPVKKAICLGIGSFDPEDGSWDSKRRTYHQCIAFLAMVEELGMFVLFFTLLFHFFFFVSLELCIHVQCHLYKNSILTFK